MRVSPAEGHRQPGSIGAEPGGFAGTWGIAATDDPPLTIGELGVVQPPRGTFGGDQRLVAALL